MTLAFKLEAACVTERWNLKATPIIDYLLACALKVIVYAAINVFFVNIYIERFKAKPVCIFYESAFHKKMSLI